MENKKIEYIEYLRVLAAFFVIVIHISSSGINDIDNPLWGYLNVWSSGSRFPVNLFYMITGMLLLNPNKNIEFKTFFKKYFLKMLIIYFVWSAIYAFYDIQYNNVNADLFIETLFKGHYHMGFLILLLAFYIAVPIYRIICKTIS